MASASNNLDQVGWHWIASKSLLADDYHKICIDWLRREWNSIWHSNVSLSANDSNVDFWFAHLTGLECYNSPARRYHNLDHLIHVLTEINHWQLYERASEEDIKQLKIALWFHDAIYITSNVTSSNEKASAQLWKNSNLPSKNIDGPFKLILVTDHLKENDIEHSLKDIMLDVDLSVLGQSREVYDDYVDGIRYEYSHVEPSMFKLGRTRILQQFLNKAEEGTLYRTQYFNSRYAQSALLNLQREGRGLGMINDATE